ncbi:MAG: BadM/Rrf2 family transcriptional regulator [Acidimicrobiales bacterium]|nr:BadM/Rrf2 family transcriptional regulator [Acidimicrobiales bacterium]
MPRLTTSLRRTGRLEHALRAVIALDGTTAEQPCSLPELLRRSPGPRKFLSTILGSLCQGGVVGSTRGSHGGYWLARPLAEISVLDVVRAVGPPGADPIHPDDPDEALRLMWASVDDRLGELLAAMSLADLAATSTLR